MLFCKFACFTLFFLLFSPAPFFCLFLQVQVLNTISVLIAHVNVVIPYTNKLVGFFHKVNFTVFTVYVYLSLDMNLTHKCGSISVNICRMLHALMLVPFDIISPPLGLGRRKKKEQIPTIKFL